MLWLSHPHAECMAVIPEAIRTRMPNRSIVLHVTLRTLKALAEPHSVLDVYSTCNGDIQLWVRHIVMPGVSVLDSGRLP